MVIILTIDNIIEKEICKNKLTSTEELKTIRVIQEIKKLLRVNQNHFHFIITNFSKKNH